MANSVLFIFLFFIVLAAAKPIPENDQEILTGSDTRFYNFPGFWYQRPLNGDDNEGGDSYGGSDTVYPRPGYHHRDSAIPLYQVAGAGWGR